MIRIATLVVSLFLLSGCISQQPVPMVDRSGSFKPKVGGAAQPVGPGYYTVKRGDNLFRIAQDHGQDFRELAGWNDIASPYAIKEGQVLRVLPPGTGEPAEAVVTKPVAVEPVVEMHSLDSSAVGVGAAANGAIKREPRVGKEPYSDEAYARLNNKTDEPKAASNPSAPAVVPASPTASMQSGPDAVDWAWPTSAKVTTAYSDASNKGLDFGGKPGDPILAAGDGKVVYAGRGLRGFGELVIVKHNATYLSAYAHNRRILVKEGQQVSKGQKIAEMGSTDADSVKLHFEIRKQGKPVDPVMFLPKR